MIPNSKLETGTWHLERARSALGIFGAGFWELNLASVVAVGAPELNDPIGKFCIDDVTVVQGTPDGLMGRVTLHKILYVEFFPRLLQVVLLPAETSPTVWATHLNSELAAAGVMQSVKPKNFSTGRTAWIFLCSRWAKVVLDDLLFFFFGKFSSLHRRATC